MASVFLDAPLFLRGRSVSDEATQANKTEEGVNSNQAWVATSSDSSQRRGGGLICIGGVFRVLLIFSFFVRLSSL